MKIAVFYENIKEGLEQGHVTIRQALERLKDAGLTMLYANARGLEADWEMLSPVLEELGIGIEGLYDFCDFAGTSPAELPPSADYHELIDTAVKVGADNVLVVPGLLSMNPDTMGEEKNRLIKGVSEAVAYGNQKGIKVSMEDFDGLEAPYNTIAGLNEFMEKIPGLYCSFDTGNFVMYHEDEYGAFRVFEKYMCTMHLKDRSDVPVYPKDKAKICHDGIKIYPSPVGYGTMKIEKILDEAIAHGYNGNVIVELFDCDADHVIEAAEKSVRWISEKYI